MSSFRKTSELQKLRNILDTGGSVDYSSMAKTSVYTKENLGVASKLELLKGFDQKDLGFSSEDEVEAPDFNEWNRDCKNSVGCESISKNVGSTCDSDSTTPGVKKGRKPIRGGDNVSEMLDLYTKENRKQSEPSTSSVVHKEARRLDQVSENIRWSTCCSFYSKDKNPRKGRRSKVKRLSPSQLQPQKQGVFWSVGKDKDLKSSSDDELLDEAEASELWPMDNASLVLLGGCDGEASNSNLAWAMEPAIQHDHHRHSMAELLDNLQGKIRMPHSKSRKGGRRKGLGQHAIIRSNSSSGKDITSDEDPCEIMHGGSSTDCEGNAQISERAVVVSGRKTMADRFQEAFGCASMEDRRPFTIPKQSSSGLSGRLQHIMQQQKEQDAEFVKKVQTELWPKDEARCIDVKILSRSFDAKLSVCRCYLLENEESSVQNPQQENFGKIWTVIFNSRVCGDVDLEVGNLIRIYPPWKEVQVLRGGEIIILTTYFSQIHT